MGASVINATSVSSGYSFDGDGTPTYPNNGTMWVTVTHDSNGGYLHGFTEIYETLGHNIYRKMRGRSIVLDRTHSGGFKGSASTGMPNSGLHPWSECFVTDHSCMSSGQAELISSDILYGRVRASDHYNSLCRGNLIMTVSSSPIATYTVSGNTNCLSSVSLYLKVNGTYYEINDTSLTGSDNYTYDIYEGDEGKLLFSDNHLYYFTCSDSNIQHDHDACSHTTYRFEDRCGNLIPDSEGYYCEYLPSQIISCKEFEEADGILDISNSSANKIEIYTNTFIGQTGWVIDPVVSNTSYTLRNPSIAWRLKVIVQDESTGALINDAIVRVDQSCYCTDSYAARNKQTVNGMVQYIDMSLQDASLWVFASGYKICDENSTGYSAFLSGRSNFSSKTWIVKLALSSSNNSSTFYEVNNIVDIHFVDVDGNKTSRISDTDSEVYLYYENNNTEEEAMTLKFQSSSTHSCFTDEDSWTIAYDDIGHKTIPNSHFTPWTYAYRAIIYNESIYLWNKTIPLTVRNATKEESLHYENLTTNLWFLYEEDGKIDYREDMKVVCHASSNNTTLMSTDIELYKDGVLLAYKNLSATNYINADFPYYYVWNPVFDYVAGSNYTIKMYGFDGTLLEVRYLECIADTITRKNKLTIGVKDRAGGNLNNAYIYLEGWGSLPTGSTYYNAYEGLDNGEYRYKAFKSGYSGSGWFNVNLSDGDEIVWYTLTEDHTNKSSCRQQLDDSDLKGMFYPMIFFLLICILLGGFKHVIK